MYPFNGAPGDRGDGPVFSSLGIPEFTQFDDRDAQVLLGYETVAEVLPGLPPTSYTITAATLTVMIESDETFSYDPTYDPYTTYLDAGDPEAEADADAGRPVIVTGAGYRNQFVSMPFPESGPFDNIPGEARDTRNVFAANDGVDVSNNIRDRIEVAPFAVGECPGLDPGDLVPNRTDMIFTLNVADADVQEYLQAALSGGRIDLVISSLHTTEAFGGSDTYPVFYFKENFAVPGTASAARLDLTVEVNDGGVVPGDANGDGLVNVNDLVAVVTDWGDCPVAGPCPADFNGDLVVDVNDLVTVILNWTE